MDTHVFQRYTEKINTGGQSLRVSLSALAV
jgi:hypothetical protein